MNSLPPTSLLGPAQLWRFLGERRNTPFVPFPAQADCLQRVHIPWPGVIDGVPYPTIFALNMGRRFSKTVTLEKLLWQGMIAPEDTFGPPCVRLTADTEEHGRKVWDRFLAHLYNTPLKALLADHSKERNLVTFTNGANVQLLSADNPHALAGDGVTLWLIDEAQYLTQAAWDNLFPSTSERNGIIVLAGVSEGEGPFREACFKGDDPAFPEYLRLVYPTAANPYVPRWRIEFALRTMAPTKFKQLYLAQWVGELGKIFRNVEGCITADFPIREAPQGWECILDYQLGHYYYAGIDLGRLSDWTVHSIWRRDGLLVAWDRFSIVDWKLQQARLRDLHNAYGRPPTVVDSTGLGDPVVEALQLLGMNVEGYQITSNIRKRQLVDEFALRVGAGTVQYPKVPILVGEMLKMEAKKSKTAGSTAIIYTAPAGATDDFVLSASLAMQKLPQHSVVLPPKEEDDGKEEDTRQRGEWETIT